MECASLLSNCGSPCFSCMGSGMDLGAPAEAILRKKLTGIGVDVEVPERHLEGVLESLLLASDSSFSLAEFAVEELLG